MRERETHTGLSEDMGYVTRSVMSKGKRWAGSSERNVHTYPIHVILSFGFSMSVLAILLVLAMACVYIRFIRLITLLHDGDVPFHQQVFMIPMNLHIWYDDKRIRHDNQRGMIL